MTVLRPCVDVTSFNRHSKSPANDPFGKALQVAADRLWTWIEGRISSDCSRLCDRSVRDIVDIIQDSAHAMNSPDMGQKLRVILTESAETLNTFSPFDKLADQLSRRDFTPIRLNYQTTLDSFQFAIIAGILKVTSHTVFTESIQSGVSIRGLDLSVIEDIGISTPIVVITEDADCIDPLILNKCIGLLVRMHAKFPKKIALIIDTKIGLDEIITDEYVYLSLEISSIPLLDANDLCRKIRGIVFDHSFGTADIQLMGIPIGAFPTSDIEYISRSKSSLTPRELCHHLALMIRNYVRKNPLAVLIGAWPLSALDFNNIDEIEGKICEIFALFYDQYFIRDIGELVGLVNSVKSKKPVYPQVRFKQISQRITIALSHRQRLGIVGRVLMNVFQATSSSILSVPSTLLEIVSFGGMGECVDENFFTSIHTNLKRICLDIESRLKGDSIVEIVNRIIHLNNNELMRLLVEELGFSEVKSPYTDIVRHINERLHMVVSSGGSEKSLVIDEIREWISMNLVHIYGEFGGGSCKELRNELVENKYVISMFACKYGIVNFGEKITCPEIFDPMIDFLRHDSNNDKGLLKRATQSGLVDKGLIDLNELVKVTYGGKGARGNAPVKNSKQIKDDQICVPSKSHFSIDYILSSKSSESIGSTLATMDFLGLVKQPGFVDIATGTVSGTTSAVKVRKIYNDTWLVAGGGKSAVEEAADDSDD